MEALSRLVKHEKESSHEDDTDFNYTERKNYLQGWVMEPFFVKPTKFVFGKRLQNPTLVIGKLPTSNQNFAAKGKNLSTRVIKLAVMEKEGSVRILSRKLVLTE